MINKNNIAFIIIVTLCILLLIVFLVPVLTDKTHNDNTRGMITGIIMALIALASGILLNKNN